VPVLAELRRGGGGAKFVRLVHSLGCGREALRQTLDFLVSAGWVLRNPGYGHPMRPEYLLTGHGARVAPTCARVLALLRALRADDVGLRRWSLPVILQLRRGAARFSELKGSLPGVTARALALSLKALQAARLVERSLVDAYPPVANYRLTPPARRLLPALGSL